MRIRRLIDPSRAVPAGQPLDLYAQPGQTIVPGAVTSLLLDLAVVVEPGQTLLVIGTPALFGAHIFADPTLRTSEDPVAALTLTVHTVAPTIVPEGVPVARGLVLDAPAESYYEDASIDVRMARPGLDFSDPGR
jgi:hypothetical protein